ncbi:MAG: F0F1 ATP synthase subunit epsilon [Pseudomonadota bacterium]
MPSTGMTLEVLLPFRVFARHEAVTSVVAETPDGSFGILPRRLDCVAALTPGILTYEREGQEAWMAVDEGLMIKTGSTVVVSVRHAVAGEDLADLRELVEREYRTLDDHERRVRSVLNKLEVGLMRRLVEFRHD